MLWHDEAAALAAHRRFEGGRIVVKSGVSEEGARLLAVRERQAIAAAKRAVREAQKSAVKASLAAARKAASEERAAERKAAHEARARERAIEWHKARAAEAAALDLPIKTYLRSVYQRKQHKKVRV